MELIRKHLSRLKRPYCIITDRTVRDLYEIEDAITIPPGEAYKTRATKEQIEDALFSRGIDRNGLLIGIGGGVICDLTGFVASTYKRGIDHILVPTTLLAMVDASIGGKCGVNTPFGKNTIGAFHSSIDIWLDEGFLNSLPEREIHNGLAEVKKAGLIADPTLLFAPLNLETIQRAAAIKRVIVEEDPFEKTGKRRVLNFGHTFAHALEAASNYTLSHGHAVGVGMRLASRLSLQMGLLSPSEFDAIEKSLSMWTLAHKPPLFDHLKNDKKSQGGKPRFVLLDAIGKPASFGGEYCSPVSEKLIEEALAWI